MARLFLLKNWKKKWNHGNLVYSCKIGFEEDIWLHSKRFEILCRESFAGHFRKIRKTKWIPWNRQDCSWNWRSEYSGSDCLLISSYLRNIIRQNWSSRANSLQAGFFSRNFNKLISLIFIKISRFYPQGISLTSCWRFG